MIDDKKAAAHDAQHDLSEHVQKFAKRSSMKKKGSALPLAFEDVRFTYSRRRAYIFPEKVPALHGISGFALPGEMLLITGPSGSGMSTLLDVLAQRHAHGKASGRVLIGGHTPTKQFARRFIAYMEQYDSLFPEMSVVDMLLYQASLIMPRATSYAQRAKRVEHLLAMLSLQDLRDRHCGLLSQGQRRRVSLGLALLQRPKVLLLDEPFTDNDAYIQDELLQTLRELCTLERLTVVAAINRPTSTAFATMDRVVMLVEGHSVYCGAAGQPALTFLQSMVQRARDPEDSNAEHAAKLLHWALLQGTHIDLAHTTTTSVATQSGATHALLQQASCKVTAIVGEGSEHVEEDTEEEEEEVVGSGSGSSPHATAQHDDDAQHAQHAVQGTPVVHDGVDVEMGAVNGAVNGVSNKSTGGGTMEVAKSDMARVWRSENRGTKRTVTPWWHALGVLWWYRGLRHFTSPRWLLPRFLDKLVFSVILAIIFNGAGDDIQATMLITVPIYNVLLITIPMFSAVGMLPTIFNERSMFYRERHDGLYRTSTYLLYCLSEEAIYVVFYSLIISLISFYVVKLQGSFMLFWLTYMLVNFTAVSLAYMIAALSKYQGTATVWIPSAAWLFLFFAGGLIAIIVIPDWLRWLPYLDPLRYAFVAMQDNHWQQIQQPIVSGSIPEAIGQVVDNLITQLLEKIPFLAPSSPTPAPPSGIGGLVSNLVGSVTGGASNIIKDLAGGISEDVVQNVSKLGVDVLMNKIKDIVESAINLPGKAGETLNQFLTDTASVTYAQVAQALFDFQQPYNAWVNYGLLWVFCAGFTVLAYVAMILFEHRGHHV